jgi:hypothetical protein
MAEQLPEQAEQVAPKGTLVGKQGRPATLHGKNKSLAPNPPKL